MKLTTLSVEQWREQLDRAVERNVEERRVNDNGEVTRLKQLLRLALQAIGECSSKGSAWYGHTEQCSSRTSYDLTDCSCWVEEAREASKT